MIQSFMIPIPPDADGEEYLLYDTVVAGRRCTTAVGAGYVEAGVVHTTPRATGTLAAMRRLGSSAEGLAPRVIEVPTLASAAGCVAAALHAAHDDDALFFLCRGPKIYDATFVALNVQFPERTALQ